MEPGVTWGGFIWLFSTHRGTANYFNQLIQEARYKNNPKGWHVYRVTLADALECGFLYKLQRKLATANPNDPRIAMDEQAYFDFVKSKAADEETFNQEYMCLPSDDASAFLSYDLLDANKYAPDVDWEQIGSGPLYLGVDVGRVKDLTVFWLSEQISGVDFTRALIRMQNATFDAQEKVFYELMERPNLRRACVDQTGIGRQFAERATKRYGSRVEGITFTGPVKETLAYPLKAALEDRTFKIPDDDKVIAAFRSIRKETTSAGNIRFVGDRNADGHADEFWAAALCKHASTSATEPFQYQRTGRESNGDGPLPHLPYHLPLPKGVLL
jgi:phage FluMu gp28-like protein